MLQVTAAAAAELAEIRRERGIPDTVGLRVYSEAHADGERAMALGFTEAPAGDDVVTEQQGTQVYVAAEMVEPLAEAALDLADTPDGPTLTLRPAQPGGLA
jgi:Fe-S cluster assembly iron-binding protein IscA